uniref:Uncharacterized protein n=1 Tax=Oryza sativa subsp. japonica TaxID=39947 RepID=Q6ZI58_ORYSJ|nr:hypothetical protein [Oryza sativa Japonica Group]
MANSGTSTNRSIWDASGIMPQAQAAPASASYQQGAHAGPYCYDQNAIYKNPAYPDDHDQNAISNNPAYHHAGYDQKMPSTTIIPTLLGMFRMSTPTIMATRQLMVAAAPRLMRPSDGALHPKSTGGAQMMYPYLRISVSVTIF